MKYSNGVVSSEYTKEELQAEYKKTLLALAKGETVSPQKLEDLLSEAMTYVK